MMGKPKQVFLFFLICFFFVLLLAPQHVSLSSLQKPQKGSSTHPYPCMNCRLKNGGDNSVVSPWEVLDQFVKTVGFRTDAIARFLGGTPLTMYVNMDEHQERRKAIEGQLAAASRVVRVPGVKVQTPHKGITIGETGCSLAHLSACRTLVESGESWALILEDDAWMGVIHEGLPSLRSTVNDLTQQHPGWTTLQVFWHGGGTTENTKPKTRFISSSKNNHEYGTVAYILRNSWAAHLMSLTRNGTSLEALQKPVADHFMYLEPGAEPYLLFPRLIFPVNTELLTSMVSKESLNEEDERNKLHVKVACNAIENTLATNGTSLQNLTKVERVSLCIPCIYEHVPHLLGLCERVKLQTTLPFEVVISLSGCNDRDDMDDLKKKLRSVLSPDVRLNVIVHDGKKYAGENRQICYNNMNGDAAVFIDADDMQHPMRIQKIKDCFNSAEAHVIAHEYELEGPKSRKWKSYKDKSVSCSYGDELWKIVTKYDKSDHVKSIPKGTGIAKIHHGHFSVRRGVPVIHSKFQRIGEDSLFLRDVLRHYGPCRPALVKINFPLTAYRPHLSSTTTIIPPPRQ